MSSLPHDAEFALPDEAATARLGRALAAAIEAEVEAVRAHGLVIGLSGDLGAGKTALVRSALRALGITGPVKSPTFALLEPYVVSSLDFYHLDFYRLGDPEEFSLAGFRELFGPGNVCAIEWPERAGSQLPAADLTIRIEVEGDGRRAALAANTELGARCLQRMITAVQR